MTFSQPNDAHEPAPMRMPQLDLPTFSFRPLQLDPQPQTSPSPSPSPRPRPRPRPQYQTAQPAPTLPQPQVQYQPQPIYAAPPAPPTIAPIRPKPRAMQPIPQFASNASPTVAAADKTFLQKLTPAHMGVMMALVTLMMIIINASPGATMRAPTTRALPALSGGGTDTLPLTRGQLANPAAATQVSGTMRGMPSAAAATHMARPGSASATLPKAPVLQMAGIPSPAAAQALGPDTLPLRPSDGTSMPRTSGERDSHANESYYTGEATLPLERSTAPVSAPAVTPGEAATNAETMRNIEIAPDGNSMWQPGRGANDLAPVAY